ncbi:MAG TPA: hypothetical protein VMN38_06780 [Sphingomicrobium sp.]|nr:hypothetical protein [Sphingomicrobium sp.]
MDRSFEWTAAVWQVRPQLATVEGRNDQVERSIASGMNQEAVACYAFLGNQQGLPDPAASIRVTERR